jgi:ADP-heptose:LPS heptosyltransferase
MTENNKQEAVNFYSQIRNCRKLLVLDLGFLGDAIHLIPSLWMIRSAMPDVRLDVVIAEHIKSIFDLTPWLDNVIGYPRFPVGPKWYEDIGRIRSLRKEKYDVVINLNGSDRTGILTYLTGAKFTLGRILNRPPYKPPVFLKYCFTNTVEVPSYTKSLFLQRCECLEKMGFPKSEIKFPITIPEQAQNKIDVELKNVGNFVHISPFTTQDFRELPVDVLADAINALHFEFVISCASNEREKNKLESLLKLLKRKPTRIFPGNLNIVELTALIARSSLHLGGDSGALHIALMTNTPSVSWFRYYRTNKEWMPQGDIHKQLVGQASPYGIMGISLDDLVKTIVQSDIDIGRR